MGLLDLGINEWSMIGGGLGLLGSKNKDSFARNQTQMNQGMKGLLSQREKDEAEQKKKASQLLLKTLTDEYQKGNMTQQQFASRLAQIQGQEGVAVEALLREPTTPKERPTGKASDGYLYYLDGNKERVLPNQGVSPTLLGIQEGIRKEVLPLDKQLSEMQGNFESLISSAQASEESRGAADQAMIFSFAKMLDPRSVVRTEEGDAIARTDGYFGQLKGFLQQVTGKGQLTPEARKGLVLEAQRQLGAKSMPVFDR